MDFKRIREKIAQQVALDDDIAPIIFEDLSSVLDIVEKFVIKPKKLDETDKFLRDNKVTLRYGMYDELGATYYQSGHEMKLPQPVLEYLSKAREHLSNIDPNINILRLGIRFQTAAIEIDKKCYIAVAVLSPKDTFSRRIGRRVVIGRLMKLIGIGTNPITGKQYWNKPFAFIL
jgi:hypothetical protein